jgi:hypothetical protein
MGKKTTPSGIKHVTNRSARRILLISIFSLMIEPIRIRVRINPPHPHVCRKMRLNRADLRMRPEKPRSRVTAGVAR